MKQCHTHKVDRLLLYIALAAAARCSPEPSCSPPPLAAATSHVNCLQCLLDAVQQHPHTTLVHKAQRMGAPLRDVGERHHGQVPIVSLVRPTERDQGLQAFFL